MESTVTIICTLEELRKMIQQEVTNAFSLSQNLPVLNRSDTPINYTALSRIGDIQTMSIRLYNNLRWAPFATHDTKLIEFAKISKKVVMARRNMGKQSIKELEAILANVGIKMPD